MHKNMIRSIIDKLILTRPLIIFDTETTGIEIENNRIVEIGCLKVFPDGTTEAKQMKLNPGMEIPEAATAIHGITNEDVAKAPLFLNIAKALFSYFDGCDYAGYNIDQYDIPMLCLEFERCGIDFPTHKFYTIDVLKNERRVNSHKLGPTYKRYSGVELDGAHGAYADTEATHFILCQQLKDSEPMTVAEMNKICDDGKTRVDNAGNFYADDEGVVRFNFGKHKDEAVKDVPKNYCNYVLEQGFPKNTKDELRKALKK